MTDAALKTFLKQREALISVALNIVQNRAIAEELVQDSWIKWAEKQYPKDKALPYFIKIVSNLARDWTRSRKVEDCYLAELLLVEDVDFDPERITIARQELARVVDVLTKLPRSTVQAFSMRYLEGITFAEIARRMKIPKQTAYSRVEKALTEIAEVFNTE